MPGVHFVWVMGADNLAGFDRWQHWRDIARLVPIAVVDRPGWRLRALASPAATSLARYRVAESLAGRSTGHGARRPGSCSTPGFRKHPQRPSAGRQNGKA